MPITTLFNTGVSASRIVLADGTIGDPHYTLTSVPTLSSTTIKENPNGLPGSWTAANSLSSWISPNNFLFNPSGVYAYTTTFSLTGFIASTASIIGTVAADDSVSVSLNGGTAIGLGGSYGQATSLALTSGFISGLNTLTFYVTNVSGPTGLRTQLAGSADVPEPASLAILATGLVGVAVAVRRRRARVMPLK